METPNARQALRIRFRTRSQPCVRLEMHRKTSHHEPLECGTMLRLAHGRATQPPELRVRTRNRLPQLLYELIRHLRRAPSRPVEPRGLRIVGIWGRGVVRVRAPVRLAGVVQSRAQARQARGVVGSEGPAVQVAPE